MGDQRCREADWPLPGEAKDVPAQLLSREAAWLLEEPVSAAQCEEGELRVEVHEGGPASPSQPPGIPKTTARILTNAE